MTELRFVMISDRINCHELMHFCQDGNILRKKNERMKRLITSLFDDLTKVKHHVDEDYNDKYYKNENNDRRITIQFIHQSVNDFLLSHDFGKLAEVFS